MLRAIGNWIWAAFFLIAFVVAIWQAAVGGKPDAMAAVVASLFDSSKTGFEIAIGLTGVMSLWPGLMKIAEERRHRHALGCALAAEAIACRRRSA